ncbi:hypothetical protein K503DRAFT_769218 [Rhizopogon vinicolor AM-OR11-026]|uniref:Uncharacterized protein n=1 Tax=Rhizopogon vinicolor AM-OR11-026 TaxID=1314800 RepID=A0A1B7N4L2_9AGAM|nr:hypothetical protein K503DRAFT_769218 [Rhizopogon vinicolor AM-OR11-026]
MVAFSEVDGPTNSGLLSPAQGSDSEVILSYYQSAAADGSMPGASPAQSSGPSSYTFASPSAFHSRSTSSTSIGTQFSTSSSAYSCDSSKAPSSAPSAYKHPQQRTVLPPGLNGATRRPSIPSEGGADRRRMAVVDMGIEDRGRHFGGTGENLSSNSTASGSPSSNLRSRRGIEAQLGGITLVAPPDASPRAYTSFTPPLTAPIQPPSMQPHLRPAPSHVRSMSEAVGGSGRNTGHVRKSSREVAVVGTTERPTIPSDQYVQTTSSPVTEALKPPIFQIPQSRSPSPGTPETSDSGCSIAPKSRRRKDALFPGVSPIKEVKETLSPAASPGPAAVITPRIGESKDIGDRVAGPVIINIFPDSPSPVTRSLAKSSMDLPTNMSSPLIPVTTPYLYYQPGLHAKAGPLPPPPMAVFSIDPRAPPPPRPPRHSPLKKSGEMEAVKQALALPPSVTAALNARTPLTEPKEEVRATTSTKSPSSEAEKETAPTLSISPMGSSSSQPVVSQTQLEEPKSKYDAIDLTKKEAELPRTPAHVREGAFSPSRICTTDSNVTMSPEQTIAPLPRHDSIDDLVASIGHAIDDMGIMRSSDVPPPTVLEPLRHNETRGCQPGLDIRRVSSTPTPPLESAQSEKGPDVLPPLPAKNERQSVDLRVRSALSIKRFSSLPRTPSRMSLNRLSSGSKKSSRTPSPSLVGHLETRVLPPVEKVKSANPPAMHFADVIVKKSALDRSLGYAQKINDLYMHDSGLGEWVAETRYKAANPQKSGKRAAVSPGARAPTTHSPRSQTRNISESSTGSEVTFPRRPDAYLATDLSTPPSGDSSPPNAPPPLPYPGLAAPPRNGTNRASTMMTSSSSSSGRSLISPASSSKSPAGFFASLGRKTSLKKDKGALPTAPVIGRVLSKSPPRSESTPRPVVIPIAPSVPGGPRAPPHRMQRSQTIVISSQSSSNSSIPHRSSTVVQRPSLLGGRNTVSENGSPIDPDEFALQVDKLCDLLPKADRTVLGGYLRRAGQDIVAIGQYLEDEKNGTLRCD